MNQSTRLLALWCPDWPVVAAATVASVSLDQPAAVFLANRVVACSAIARVNGVRRGMRRREAQAKCPELLVFFDDPERDARLFEPVAAVVEKLIVGIEVVRPGLVAVPVCGAEGYFGGQLRLVERLVEQVTERVGVECQIGIANGLFAAELAARRAKLVPDADTAEFLAPLDIGELDRSNVDLAELVSTLRRLGVRTLGAFAVLPEREVVSRFGEVGVRAHRLARGLSARPLARRRPAENLSVVEECDPPLDRIDTAAFLAKSIANRLHSALAERGLTCTRLGIHAVTENAEELSRVWRCAEPLSPQGIADRVRWQFAGWLRVPERPTAGISRLRLVPEETVGGRALQLSMWQRSTSRERALMPNHAHTPAAEQAARALVRVQGLLGSDGALIAVPAGGRAPGERVRYTPWGEQQVVSDPPDAVWPGQLPTPAPATVYAKPPPARVLAADGTEISPTQGKKLAEIPNQVVVPGVGACQVLSWAGPWMTDRLTYVPNSSFQARIQVILAGEPSIALLLRFSDEEDPQWTIEGRYD